MSITDNGEIYFHVPRGGVAKVHSAPIDTPVRQLDVVDQELCRVGRSTEVRAVRKRGWRGPELCMGHGTHPHVVAASEREGGRGTSVGAELFSRRQQRLGGSISLHVTCTGVLRRPP